VQGSGGSGAQVHFEQTVRGRAQGGGGSGAQVQSANGEGRSVRPRNDVLGASCDGGWQVLLAGVRARAHDDGAHLPAHDVARRKLKLKANFESGSLYFSFKR
jgi:hypothetical protein